MVELGVVFILQEISNNAFEADDLFFVGVGCGIITNMNYSERCINTNEISIIFHEFKPEADVFSDVFSGVEKKIIGKKPLAV